MASVGLVGGLGPESTVDYYKRILETIANKYPEDLEARVLLALANMAILTRLTRFSPYSKSRYQILTSVRSHPTI